MSRAINSLAGVSFKILINRYRIEYAKRLLIEGACSPDRIPAQCGFASRSAYYASFQKLVGTTPMRYLMQVLRERKENSHP